MIGMSNTWQWIPYKIRLVDIDGKRLPSVSAHALGRWRVDQLLGHGPLRLPWLRGGTWGDKVVLPPA